MDKMSDEGVRSLIQFIITPISSAMARMMST